METALTLFPDCVISRERRIAMFIITFKRMAATRTKKKEKKNENKNV